MKTAQWIGCEGFQILSQSLGPDNPISHPKYLSSVPRSIQAQALSCLANVYFRRSFIDKNAVLIINLFEQAGQLANICVSRGLVTHGILYISRCIERLGLRRQAECRWDINTTPFQNLVDLWRAHDTAIREGEADDQKRIARPDLYSCATETCGIEAMKKSDLFQCSGDCPSPLLQQGVSKGGEG
jgi:hypothetical protein